MVKFFWRLVCLAFIVLIVFIALSLLSGGEKFRRFGKQVERESEKVGESADKIKGTSVEVMRGIEKTKKKIEDLTGKKREESH